MSGPPMVCPVCQRPATLWFEFGGGHDLHSYYHCQPAAVAAPSSMTGTVSLAIAPPGHVPSCLYTLEAFGSPRTAMFSSHGLSASETVNSVRMQTALTGAPRLRGISRIPGPSARTDGPARAGVLSMNAEPHVPPHPTRSWWTTAEAHASREAFDRVVAAQAPKMRPSKEGRPSFGIGSWSAAPQAVALSEGA